MLKLFQNYRDYVPPVFTKAIYWLKSNLFKPNFNGNPINIIKKNRINSVQNGPFKGMMYGPYGSDKFLLARLFGSYEKELHVGIEKIINLKPDVVVVAGGGEGYYAVGLASRLPKSNVIAFEISKWGRYLTKRHAQKNGVSLEIKGFCSPHEMSLALDGSQRPAIVCDIEGGEVELMDPVLVPDLKKCHILIELHPMYIRNIEDIIVNRFKYTHKIDRMELEDRVEVDIPDSLSCKFSSQDALRAMDEVRLRGTGLWLLLSPN